jgi:hypothetical protein
VLQTYTLTKQASTMPSLNATNPADWKEIADIAFLDLALHTGRPYLIRADQTIQQAVRKRRVQARILSGYSRRKLSDTVEI